MDNSPRVIKKENPNNNKREAEYLRLSSSSDDWGYLSCLEDDLEDKYGPSTLKIKDKPLVELPTFRMTREQKIKTSSKTGIGSFEIFDVGIRFPDDSRLNNVLFAQRVPPSMKIDLILKKVSRICDHDVEVNEIFRGSNRCIQLNFKKISTDAQKVFLMYRKRYFGKNLLIFNYQFKKVVKKK